MHPAGPNSLYSTLASIVGNSQVPHSPIPLDPIDVKLIGLFSVDTALKASTEQENEWWSLHLETMRQMFALGQKQCDKYLRKVI